MLSTIRARITTICVAIVIGILVCSTLVTYVITRRDDTATLYANLDALTGGNAKAIDEWVDARASIVAAVSKDSLLGDPRVALRQLQASGGFMVSYAGYADKHAAFSRDLGVPSNFDPTSRLWYREAALAKKLIVTNPYADIATKQLVVTFAHPLLTDGRVDGVVGAEVSLEGINAIVGSIHPSPSSFAFLVDPDGRIVANSDPGLNTKPATQLSPDLSSALLARASSGNPPVQTEVNGRSVLIKGETIAGTNWELVVALDEAEGEAGLAHVLTSSVITLLVVAGISGIAISVITALAFARLSNVRAAMEDVASGEGDLTRRLPSTGNDEVTAIAHAFNRFADRMADVMREIRATGDSVAIAAAEISQGNRDLSSRTEQAASSLAETAASMEEINGAVRNTADAAAGAGNMAAVAAKIADKGGSAVSAVVETMSEISSSSVRIRDIIAVIDGIAFQTNILALNASVEAARAGEQGRGFAVVAGEVRALAQRSAQAAREIAGLIVDSVARVAAGAALVERAGNTMGEIVVSVDKVASILREISVAANEQSKGISQVNVAVAQLDDTTQQNAALVEQAAAASDLLHDQASRLALAVNGFKL